MRLKIAIPKFNSTFNYGDTAEFRFVEQIDPKVEATHDIFSISGSGISEADRSNAIWEVLRVRSNRTRKEMKLSAELTEKDFIYRFSCRGPSAWWQLESGHYVLRVFVSDALICEASFFIPWPDDRKDIERLEHVLDQNKVPNEYRKFLISNESRLMEELVKFSRQEFGDDKQGPEFLKTTLEIAIRVTGKAITESSSDDSPRLFKDKDYFKFTMDAAINALKAQSHTLELLEKVFELAQDRHYDDNELEALVNLLVRGTDLEKYDEFGILQVIINNARNMRIDETRKKASPTARVWEYEERNRQLGGYLPDSEGIEHRLPDGPTDEFDENVRRLSAKKRRLITPHLVLSIHNDNSGESEAMELPIDETWTIGRQTGDELKKFGAWHRPFVDYENRRVILAGYYHNTFSKNLISIVPTYKHSEYMGLGRTVSLLNPSDNYAISLSEKIKLDPGASYATPSHLFFYYAVAPDAIRLSDAQKLKLKLTDTQAAVRYSVRIDVFFEEINKGDMCEVLVAKHDWVGKEPSRIYDQTLKTMKPDEV